MDMMIISELIEKQKNYILEETRKLLKDHEKVFTSITAANMKILTEQLEKNEKVGSKNLTKINNIVIDLETTNKNAMSLAADCSDIIKAIQINEKIITDKFEVVKKKKKELSNKMKDNSKILKIKSKLREIEDSSRRSNLRIEGIKENGNENLSVNESKVQKLFEDILGLKNIKMERAYRIGLRSTHKIRPIVVKIINYKDKVDILKQAKNLILR
ncbi:uncharacterized protein LOC124812557 [Hydra vulgaris]|uniref:uncharacterized protein LOC124812557 n=1 Tax=Hydra vulgaris TaxID=6087 RepID=UPI001F5E4BCC|nr:uncharacterized protein LOC124812557 [Hydra vulgaris]